MYKAVQMDNPEALRRLLDRGADANQFYQDLTLISAKSILHMCCEKGRFECVKVRFHFKGMNKNSVNTLSTTSIKDISVDGI